MNVPLSSTVAPALTEYVPLPLAVLIRDVERTLQLALKRQPLARRADRRLDEYLERRLRCPRSGAAGSDRSNGEQERERCRKASHFPPRCQRGSSLFVRHDRYKLRTGAYSQVGDGLSPPFISSIVGQVGCFVAAERTIRATILV